MRIYEGNLFEAMRLMLPEHREVMLAWQRTRSARRPPMLAEDAIQEMQYTLSEAVATGVRVRLTLFGEYGDTVLEGLPRYDGRLRLATDAGVKGVEGWRLIQVEWV